MDLDDLLDRSAPPTTSRTPSLARELDALVLATESVGRPRRRALRAAMTGALTAGLVGVGTAGAMATGLVPTPAWVPWATDAGSTCEMQFTATAAGRDGEPPSRTYTDAQAQRAASEASTFLVELDYASIDEADAIESWREGEAAAIASQPDPAERQAPLTGDDLALTAVGAEVWDRVAAHLDAKGMASELVVLGQGWRCEG